jgi:hypothetical protein
VATFIEIQTDAFAENIKALKTAGIDQSGVRRPYRGIEIKEDTYGIIKVIKADGTEVPLVDAGGAVKPRAGNNTSAGSGVASQTGSNKLASTYNYSNFIIQRVDESRQEKSQVLETFGDTFIFFFGERPRILNVSGLLMNTLDFNWRTEFWYNYENTLRGTKLVEQNARMYLHWDDIIVEGYMLQAQARDDSEMPYHIPFSFSMFVTSHIYLSQIGSEDYPITNAVNLEPLLHLKDVERAKRELKKDAITAEEIKSTTEAVRLAAQNAELSRQAAAAQSFSSSSFGQKFNASKNLLANALIVGLNAQNLTFLSIANHYFKNRKMRFPRGIAGAESYAGPPTIANDPTQYGFAPKRTLPLRSKIRDNVDEYTKSGVVGWNGSVNIDYTAEDAALEEQQYKDGYAMELAALQDLEALGLDPVQHPGGSPFERAHNLAIAGSITASAIARWGLGQLR